MKTLRRFFYLSAAVTIGLGVTWGVSRHASATNAPQALPFSQNWSNASLITVDNNWNGVPGIIGYRGNDLSTIVGTDLRFVMADGSGTAVSAIANQASPDIAAAFGAGGVLEFDGIGNRTIALHPTVNADVPHIVLSLNTTGKSNIRLSFKTRDLNTYAGIGNQQINTQFRVGGTGDYENVTGGYVLDASGPGVGAVIPFTLTLPPSANDQSLLEVRIMTINSTNVNVIGIDDINVFGTPISSPQTLPFHQNWSDMNLITLDNDWSEVPGIIGFRGDNLIPTLGQDLRTLVADGSGTPVNVYANKIDTGILLAGGVWEFDGIGDPTIAVQGGTLASSPHIVISLDTTGSNNIQLSYNARDLSAGGGTITEVNTQVRIGGTGTYTNIEGGYISDANVPVTPVSVTLPPEAENQPLVEIRIITTKGSAGFANEAIGIDDIEISATVPQTPPFEESWSDGSLITEDDNWSGVPGIVGYRGDGLSTIPDEDLRTIVADGSTTPVDVNANEDDPDTFAEGGVTEFDGIPDPTIALKGSETADVPHLVLSLDTTGMSNVQVSYNAKCLSGGGALTSACTSGGASQQVNTQSRLGGSLRGLGETGEYLNLDGGYVANANGPDLVTPVNVTLPAWANDQPLVEVRIMTGNATGEDAFIGIDDIEVTGTVAPPLGTVGVSIPSDLSGLTGSTLTVPVNVTEVSGLGIVSYDFTVTFDPAVITPSVVNFDLDSTLSAAYTITTNPAAPGTLVVSGFGTSALAGSGALLKLKFDLVGDGGSCSPLSLSPFEFNEGNPPAQTTAGQVCVFNGSISGNITYGNSPTETPVENVLVTADGSPVVTDLTDASGAYTLTGLGAGPYVVTPEKMDDVNGITAFDAALIAQNVVGIITFTPNQSLAADVSGNGTITSFDAAQIAQYVIEIPNPGVTGTWKFSPESRDYPSTTSPITNEDYTAILMGEVSGNWTPPSLGQVKVARKSEFVPEDTIDVRLPAAHGLQNTTISIPVIVGEEVGGQGVLAYEIDLNYDPATLQPETSFASANGTMSAGMSVSVNNTTPGRSRIAVFGTNPLQGLGTLLNLRFKVIGNVGQSSPLTWTRFAFNEGQPASATSNGQVTVTGTTNTAVSVGGRVVTANGTGIPRAIVTIADTNGSRHAMSNSFGYFHFSGIMPGQAYVISVGSKRYDFSGQTQVVFVGDHVTNLLFVGQE